MNIAPIRKQALALPDVIEAPHFHYTSFRVGGKIFITVPPEETHVHLFVGEQDRERTLALYPAFCEKLMWGARALGLRIALVNAQPAVVKALVEKAWANKAPKRLLATRKAKPQRGGCTR